MILLSGPGCGGNNSQRREAEALLARISAVDLSAPFDQRARQVERLRALQVHDPQLAGVRDACVRVQAGLLEAERQQAAARERLAGSSKPSEAELDAVARKVASAGARLRQAQAELPACERSTRELAERYR